MALTANSGLYIRNRCRHEWAQVKHSQISSFPQLKRLTSQAPKTSDCDSLAPIALPLFCSVQLRKAVKTAHRGKRLFYLTEQLE